MRKKEKAPPLDLIGKVKFDGTTEQLKGNPRGWRGYFIQTYATKEQINDILVYSTRFAWITHDRDVDPSSGELKAPHSHFIVRYSNQYTPLALAKKFYQLVPDERTVISPLGDKYAAIDYMLHRDPISVEQGKTLYKEQEIFTDDSAYFFRSSEELQVNHKNEDFLSDLLSGVLTMREMAVRYGRDYMKNYHHYHEFAKQVKMQDAENARKEKQS